MQTTQPGPAVGREFAEHVARREPMRFSHGMTDHPMVQLDEVAELGARLGPQWISAEQASKPFVSDDPDSHARELVSIADQIREIAANDSWFTLLHVEREQAYRRLVGEIIDGVADRSGLDRAELQHRMGFVFASSPGSVTKAHFDVENSLLMQLRGRRRLYFGSFADATEREDQVRRYWAGGFGKLQELPRERVMYEVGPGDGAYIPPWTPHWLTNGDELSLSLTVTFFNEATTREVRAQVFNHHLTKIGVTGRVVGPSPRRDAAKARVVQGIDALRKLRDPDYSPFG